MIFISIVYKKYIFIYNLATDWELTGRIHRYYSAFFFQETTSFSLAAKSLIWCWSLWTKIWTQWRDPTKHCTCPLVLIERILESFVYMHIAEAQHMSFWHAVPLQSDNSLLEDYFCPALSINCCLLYQIATFVALLALKWCWISSGHVVQLFKS